MKNADSTPVVTETLHCKVCDKDFDRIRKRGVKPTTCDNCKATAEIEKTAAAPVRTNGDFARVEALGVEFVTEVCREYQVTPRIAIPFLLEGQMPPTTGTHNGYSGKEASIINSFNPDLSPTGNVVEDYDELTGAYTGDGATTAQVLGGLDLYKIPS